MNQIIIEVNRKEIVVSNNHILKNYWYKYVTAALQAFVEDNEKQAIAALGEDLFEEIYDLIDNSIAETNRSDFQEDEISKEVVYWGEQIESIILSNELAINIRNNIVSIKKDRLIQRTNDYFKAYIIPYLQIDNEREVTIECADEKLKKLFERQLKENGIHCQIRKEDEATDFEIRIIENDNDTVKYIGDNVFEIKHDLGNSIQIDVQVQYKNAKTKRNQINVIFPYYKKGDPVEIKTYNLGTDCGIIAENLSSHIIYKSRF